MEVKNYLHKVDSQESYELFIDKNQDFPNVTLIEGTKTIKYNKKKE